MLNSETVKYALITFEVTLNEEASRTFNADACWWVFVYMRHRNNINMNYELIVCCCCIYCHPMLKFHFCVFFNFISIPYLLFWFQCFQLWIIWGKTILLFTLTVCDVSPFHFDYYSTFGVFCMAQSCETQSLRSIIVICWVTNTPTRSHSLHLVIDIQANWATAQVIANSSHPRLTLHALN